MNESMYCICLSHQPQKIIFSTTVEIKNTTYAFNVSMVSVCYASRFQASTHCSFPAQSSESSFQHILCQPNCSPHRGQHHLSHPALSPPAAPRRQRLRSDSNLVAAPRLHGRNGGACKGLGGGCIST